MLLFAHVLQTLVKWLPTLPPSYSETCAVRASRVGTAGPPPDPQQWQRATANNNAMYSSLVLPCASQLSGICHAQPSVPTSGDATHPAPSLPARHSPAVVMRGRIPQFLGPPRCPCVHPTWESAATPTPAPGLGALSQRRCRLRPAHPCAREEAAPCPACVAPGTQLCCACAVLSRQHCLC